MILVWINKILAFFSWNYFVILKSLSKKIDHNIFAFQTNIQGQN